MISDSNQVPGISLKPVKEKILTQFYLPSSICYIHNKSIGNIQLCEDAIDRKLINEIYDSNQVAGISIKLVRSFDDGESKFIFNLASIEKQVTFCYPFVMLTVSPFKEYEININTFILSNGYFRLHLC
jgi:hypothetical protein